MKLTVEGLEKERDFYFGEIQKLNPTNYQFNKLLKLQES